jgi:uncharacterized protein YndB with AHSA1/START domain
MPDQFVESSVEIHAPVSNVWRVFTDPILTREMGGEYASDWKVGSSFGWMTPEGQMITNGSILKLEPEKLLQHNLFDEDGSVAAVITYEFHEAVGVTTIHAREDFSAAMDDDALLDARAGWEAALHAVKEIAERSYG